MVSPKVQKSTVEATWVSCETIVEKKRYDLQLVNWVNGQGSDLFVVTGKEEHRLSLPSEAWAALRILLKKHGGFGRDWFDEGQI